MNKVVRYAALPLAAAAMAACNRPQPGNEVPLAYAPADTPYAYANLEPQPKAMVDWSSRQMQTMWPTLIGMYERMTTNATKLDDREKKIVSAILDELRTRDTPDKLREIGYKFDARAAIYGVGLIPVLRVELSDPAAFKAMIARVEGKVGEKIPTGKTGDQEYWQFGDEDVQIAVAVQGSQLVATLWTPNANDTVKQLLLGIKKPEKNLLEAGTLQALQKKYNFSPYGEGYIDFAALAKRLSSAPTGIDLEIAKAMNLPTDAVTDNPECVAETQALTQKFPRAVLGAEALSPSQIKIVAQLETDSALSQALMAAFTAAPGTGAPADGLIDISIATPLLKLKDFWLKQADAVTAKPFPCAEFSGLNEMFAKSRQQLSTTIPPPFSDLTGLRLTIDKLEPRKGNNVPEFAAKLLIGSNNPLAAVGMAQMALPQLKDLKITTDGKPVALPAGMMPNSARIPPISFAVTDKAIALISGQGEESTLPAYFAAPPSSTPVFLRMHFSGAIYGLLGKYSDTLIANLPADQKTDFAAQAQLFSLYEKMIRSGEFTLEINPNGIAMRETMNLGE